MKKYTIKTSGQIGVRIKERRKELGISQEELAEALDVTYQQVQRYENGSNKLNVENIQLIAEILSVPVSYFFGAREFIPISEKRASYAAREENKLLKSFRKIKNKSSQNMIMKVIKLAGKNKAG
ncbi:MAG: helix-turn-helix transcriptional regulator [bacterium]